MKGKDVMKTKIVLIVVTVILAAVLLPEIVIAFLTKLDGILYITFRIVCNLMKLFTVIGMFTVVVLLIVLLVKGVKARK